MIANFEPRPDRYTIWSNFQGPFVLQPLMAAALNVPGNHVRIITPPDLGGSFGLKQAVYAYMVLMAAVSRLLGVPVKWTEDRLEHLMASSSATDRLGEVEAAFTSECELTGLRFGNVVNLGAYIRAPEPASVYRMHSTSNGPYRVKNIAVENVLVVTNRMPAGLNRGYGGRSSTSRSSASWTSPRAAWGSTRSSCGAATSSAKMSSLTSARPIRARLGD